MAEPAVKPRIPAQSASCPHLSIGRVFFRRRLLARAVVGDVLTSLRRRQRRRVFA